MGLDLNVSKCEIICDPSTVISNAKLRSFQRIATADASLLGAPLFQGPVLDGEWSRRCADMSRAADRLSRIASQDALLLLRVSFSAPRVQHLLRCSPSAGHGGLDGFDKSLRSAVNRITNCNLSDSQWIQASLPVRDGGLGVRRVATLALPAFLASAASTLPLQDAILSTTHCPPDSFVVSFRTAWSSSFGLQPVGGQSCKQSVWDRPGIMADKAVVETACANSHQKASFLAAQSPHSGDWLAALPISSCGLRLGDEAVRVAVAVRLGLDLCVPHACALCDSQVDAWGSHALVCKRAPGKILRHTALNDAIARAFGSAGVPVKKEPSGLLLNDSKRPDGLTLIPWQSGKPLTWDVTVATTIADSYVTQSATSAGAAAELAASRKRAKYSDLPASVNFEPMAFETHGAINTSAIDCFSDIGRRVTLISGDKRETSFLFQRLSVIVQRFNSILLHDSFSVDTDPDL